MSIRASGIRLTAVTRQILSHWQETKEYWKDVKSKEFDRDYMAELQAGVDQAVATIEELEKLITKIRTDCE
jgi:hypothetical protein